MTITIERTPMTLQWEGQDIQVEQLGIRLPFARKPADLKDMSASGDYVVYVTETRTMTPEEFDGFAPTCWPHATGWPAKVGMWVRGACAWKSTPPVAHICMSIRQAEITRATPPVWASGSAATLCIFFNRRVGFLIEQRVNGVIAKRLNGASP